MKLIVIALASLLVVGVFFLVFADKVGECLDNGGYWNYARDTCECTYADTGHYSNQPSAEQSEEQARCKAIVEGWVEDRNACDAKGANWDQTRKICSDKIE